MKRTAGFTFLEMSIVLTVIALIIGAILIGKHLIRSSELLSVISDAERYRQAITTFKTKYHYYPGDLPNAESFWGLDPAGCPGTYTTTPRNETCNGNGDGMIGYDYCGVTVSTQFETFRAWQQLADAGLIKGAYNGVSNTGSVNDYVIGVNAPAASLNGGMWQLGNYLCGFAGAFHYPENFTVPILTIGTKSPNSFPWNPLLSSIETQDIDAKVDDGMPATGYVRALVNNPACETDATTSATYTGGSSTVPACALEFIMNERSDTSW